MRALKIENGDLVLDSSGNFVEVENEEEEAQAIERILTTRLGEWFLNANHGLNYNAILSKPFDEEAARAAIVEAVTQDPRVEEVSEIEFDFDRKKRHLNIRVAAVMNGNNVEVVVPIG